jgi:hypothetical protein
MVMSGHVVSGLNPSAVYGKQITTCDLYGAAKKLKRCEPVFVKANVIAL